jgi:Tfp pilus assembly protein PilE
MVEVLAVAAVVAILFAVAYWQFPRATERWFNRIATARSILWSVFLLAFAFVALTAGTVGYAIIGGAILGYAFLYVRYERPFDPLRDYFGL